MVGPSFLRGFLSLAQVAERFAVDRSTVSRWCAQWTRTKGREGLGPVVRLGRRCVRVDVVDVQAFVVRMSDPKREMSTSRAAAMGRATGTPAAKGAARTAAGDQGRSASGGSVDGVSTGSLSEVVGNQVDVVRSGGVSGGCEAETAQAGGGGQGCSTGGRHEGR